VGDIETKQQSRQRVIKSLVSSVTRYNEFLTELRSERKHINNRRESGAIPFKEYWHMRIDLEGRIQEMMERRDAVSRELVLVFAQKPSS
jgi:predicted transcriptional regulator